MVMWWRSCRASLGAKAKAKVRTVRTVRKVRKVLTRLGACVLGAVVLVPVTSAAQSDGDRIMQTVRAAVAPALPFPATDDAGAVPVNNSTEALWMVRPLQPGDRSIEVIANPLNEVNQLRATRAMAEIERNIEAAQRRAAAQYDRAVSEAKRTGRSQEVDGVTLTDEGVAGARIDAESHVIIDVAFNEPAYRSTFHSGTQPNPSVEWQKAIPGSTAVVTLPSNTYRDIQSGVERYAEGETLVYLGRMTIPVMKKRGDESIFEVSATATPSEGVAVQSLVVRLRGNEALIAEILRKTNWNAVLELTK